MMAVIVSGASRENTKMTCMKRRRMGRRFMKVIYYASKSHFLLIYNWIQSNEEIGRKSWGMQGVTSWNAQSLYKIK